jgi:hypothetical protein
MKRESDKRENAVLVIFVDALPFDRGAELARKLGSVSRKKVIPGIGYSINVKTEIFAGIKPDEVGYFCEWNYTAKRELPGVLGWSLGIAGKLIPKFGFFDKALHRVVAKLIGRPVYGIPLTLLPYMRFSGPTAYEHNFSRPTFLSDHNFRRILYSELGVKDDVVFENALNVLERERSEKLFVATAELDGVMHHYGMHCERYENQIALITEKAEQLVRKFLDLHGKDAKYYIFSDHGMADVTEPVEIDVEKILGQPGPGSYGYFVDATFLRIWVDDKSIRGSVEAMLDEMVNTGRGFLLDSGARELYGLKDGTHGDYIFLLNEGKMFFPSFFGRALSKAMHGYKPDLDSQQGVLISNAAIKNGAIEAEQIYKLVSDACT